MKSSIVVELAGRDSFVALHRYLKSLGDKKQHFILSIVKTPPEELDVNNQMYLLDKLIPYLINTGHSVEWEIHDGANDHVWFTMVKSIFGYNENASVVSPCIMCHLFCHLMRLDDAIKYDAAILSGERSLHDGKLKINQNDDIFNITDIYFAKYGIDIIRPLRDISDSNLIKSEYEDFCKLIGLDINAYKFTPCSLSGSGKVANEEELKLAIKGLNKNLYDILDQAKEKIKRGMD